MNWKDIPTPAEIEVERRLQYEDDANALARGLVAKYKQDGELKDKCYDLNQFDSNVIDLAVEMCRGVGWSVIEVKQGTKKYQISPESPYSPKKIPWIQRAIYWIKKRLK